MTQFLRRSICLMVAAGAAITWNGASPGIALGDPFVPLDGLYRVDVNGPLATSNGLPAPKNPVSGEYAVRTSCAAGRCGASGVALDSSGSASSFATHDNFLFDPGTNSWSSNTTETDDCGNSSYAQAQVQIFLQPMSDGTFQGTETDVFSTVCPHTWQAPITFTRLGDFPPNLSLT
jgi:hypothetical protein